MVTVENQIKADLSRTIYLALIFFSLLNYAVNGIYAGMKYKGGDFLNYYVIAKLLLAEVNIHDDQLRESAIEELQVQNPHLQIKKFHQPDYPPFWYMVLSPLTAFSYEIAFGIWLSLNQFFLFAALYLLFKYFNIRIISLEGAFSITLFLNFYPLWYNMMEGQVNVFLLLLIIGGLQAFKKDSHCLAGLLLGLAASIKIVPALLIFYFLLKGHWRVVFWSAVCFAFTVAFSLITVNPELVLHYFTSQIFKYGNVPRPEHFNQSINGFVSRLFTDSRASHGWIDNPFFSRIITIILSLVVLSSSIYFSRGKFPKSGVKWNLGFALFITAMLMMSSWTLEHHFVFLYFVWLAMLDALIHNGGFKMQNSLLSALLFIFLAVFIPYQSSRFAGGIFIPILSLKFYAVTLLWFIVGINLYRSARTT